MRDSTYPSSMSDDITYHKTKLDQLMNDIKNIYMGARESLDTFVIQNTSIDPKKVDRFAQELASLTECTPDEQSFYFSFYKTTIWFLYASCNAEDRIMLSIPKIASTFGDLTSSDYYNSTFYYLIEGALEHQTETDTFAIQHMLDASNSFAEFFKHNTIAHEIPRHVAEAMDIFLCLNSLSCLSDSQKFTHIFRALRIAKVECAEAMGLI